MVLVGIDSWLCVQAVAMTMSDEARHMPGWNSHPELYKPSLADIDEFGCDNDTSQ
jgi:hypothetical protein